MRRALTLAGLGLALVLTALWLSGAFDALSGWIGAAQRATQDRLAAAVRALRAGEPGAVAGLLAVCFGYGVLHAAGPGHGKALIGGYGLARRVPLARLSVLALASSLAQAAVAVALVYAAVAVLGLTRDAVTAAGGGWVTATGNLMVAGLGLWLVIRGLRGLRRLRRAAQTGAHAHDHHAHAHDHAHDHDHGPDCGCGHAHGPTLDQAAAVTSFRDAGLLIAGIALRPCSGALLLLVLTWQLGIGAAGIAGAFAMGLGVAVVTVAVAGLAVWAREGGLAVLPEGRLRWALPAVELTAGLIIATAAIMLLLRQI